MVSVLQIGAAASPARGEAEAWRQSWPSALSAAEQAVGPSHAKTTLDSRQLMPVDVRPSHSRSLHPSSHRPAAPFLAQLIAVKEQVPQMRARKRTDPRSGAEAYADMVRLVSHRHDEESAMAARSTACLAVNA